MAPPRSGPQLRFVVSTLTVGGFERHLGQLVPALRDRGFAPTVVTLRDEGEIFRELRDLGIPMRFAAMRSRTDLRGLRRAISPGDPPDVVVSQSIDAHVAAAIVARRARAPHVAVEHAAPELLRGRRRHHLTAYALVAPRVARAVALSRTQIPELLRLHYRDDAIRVIPNGIARPTPQRSRAQVRAELELGAGDFVVTLVATLRPEKRADLFFDAVLHAHRANPAVRGLIVGGGPHLEQLRQRAAGAPGVVAVLGERSDVADLIAASDAVGLSSLAECLPLSVLEAMALARPVVGTDVGGMRELVADGETGLLVSAGSGDELAAAIARLAGDRQAARAMGEAARRRYEQVHTLERMVDAYSALFAELSPSSARVADDH